jgi:cytochrome c-type biogenesis protein CcmH/NrfG
MPSNVVAMQRIRTRHFAAATLAVLFLAFVLLFPALAQNQTKKGAATPPPPTPVEITLDELQQAKLDAEIAQAKAEVIGANNSTMGVLVTGITGFTTLLLGGFAFATYKQAASAARDEIRAAKDQVDALLSTARAAADDAVAARVEIADLLAASKSAVDAIEANEQRADAITDSLEARINSPPTAEPEPLPAGEQTELNAAVEAAEATPRAQRSAQQFRQLMFAAEQAGDWRAYREQAEGMAYLFADKPNALAFALFGRAFASQQLGDLIAAATGYADYLDRCPNESAANRATAFNNWGTALYGQAKTKSGADADALFALAGEKYAEAVRIKPDMDVAFNNWGAALADRAKTKSGADADALFALAGEKYAEAVRIKPDMHETFNDWGSALADQAKTKSGADAHALFALAGEKYAEAVRIKPDMHEAFNNWGTALSGQAKTKSGADADALFALAGEKYAEAVRIKPDMHEAFNNWGAALSAQAKTKSGADADALFALAGEKYAEAVRIKPDTHEAFNNWGTALADQAKTKSGADADALFALAGEKYAEAVRTKPDMHEAFNNWGTALADQAKTKSGADADALFALAGEKYAEADTILLGSSSYNRACLAALRGNAQQAAHLLRAAKADVDCPDCEHIAADSDFDAVRSDPAFQAALVDIGCGPATA